MNSPAVRLVTTHLTDPPDDRTDAELLARFVRERDGGAFARLVGRHGPMVLGVCRRVLRNEADAEDAFQAAFLVLARKAGTIRGPLGPWLHGVAVNVARRIRRANARRAVRVMAVAELPEPASPSPPDRPDELLAVMDEELARLPDRYRVPLVVCDLEGTTRADAARLLGWPEGTVAGRLARARARLAARLTARCGVPAAVVLAILPDRAAAVSPPLAATAVRLAVEPIPIPPRIAGAAEGVLKAMLLKKLAAGAVVFGSVALAALGLSQFPASAQPPITNEKEPPPGLVPPKSAEKGAAPTANPAATVPSPRVLTLIPLKKLDPAATARVLTDAFGGRGAVVTPAADEKALLLYADAAVTKEIDALLVKLGEEPRKRASVIRLQRKVTDSATAARTVREAFGTPRVTVVPVPDENALLVYADELDTATIRKLLDKWVLADLEPPRAAPPAKTFSFRMKDVPWKDVFQWYATAADLPVMMKATPAGTFTFEPPAGKEYTLAEVTDILNDALVAVNFLLVRGEKAFVLIDANREIDPSLIPRVRLEDLGKRGRTELVSVVVSLKAQKASDLAPEVRKLLGVFGDVRAYEPANSLFLRDTAGNLKKAVDAIRELDKD